MRVSPSRMLPAAMSVKARDAAQQRGLAAAEGPEQGEQLSITDGQGDAIHRPRRAGSCRPGRRYIWSSWKQRTRASARFLDGCLQAAQRIGAGAFPLGVIGAAP